MKKRFCLILFLFIIAAGCSPDHTEEGISNDPIQIIAPSFRNGGWDLTAREMQKILSEEEIVKQEMQVMNKTGAGGETGWKYLIQNKGNSVIAMNSSLIITNQLLGQSQLDYNDFTPLATLATEWEVVVVSKDSRFNNARQLMDQLKENMNKNRIGVSPRLGNDDQLSFVLASSASGIKPEELDFFAFADSEEIIHALLNNEIDAAAMTLSEAKKYYQSGKVKILAVSSEKRQSNFPEIPTWVEQDIDLVFSHWRGVMGPPDMSEEEIRYWDRVFYKMVQTKRWKEVLDRHEWDSLYKSSQETRKFLDAQSKLYEQMMGETGAIH
jgi:tripartite-type tricarboxylate transporter receptor subunit TctC